MDLIDELIADDFVEHEEFPGPEQGRDITRAFVTLFRSAFPDLTVTPEDIIVEGDKVVVRSTLSGTHRGEFMGIPPTGQKFDVQGIDILRVRDGKATEHWGVTDAMGMMQQLGVMEGPPA